MPRNLAFDCKILNQLINQKCKHNTKIKKEERNGDKLGSWPQGRARAAAAETEDAATSTREPGRLVEARIQSLVSESLQRWACHEIMHELDLPGCRADHATPQAFGDG